jgi:RHS repeat-associated protein
LSESTTGYSQTRNYDSTRDLLKEMTTKFSTTTKSRYDYTFNSLGQRDTAKQNGQTGSAFADFGNDTYYRYTYNSRGELTAAVGYLGTTVTSTASPLPGRNYQFAYDTAGNRTSANSTGVTGLLASFSPNYLNQITDHDNIFVPVSGTVDSAAKVVVNGNLAGQQGNYWSGEVLLSNTSTPAYTTTLAVKAAKASPETKQIASLLSAFIGPLSEHLIYDEDGNLKSDGRWTYTWDAENRLTQLETTTAAITAGLPKARLVFNYDSLGRRTMKEVYNFPSGSATLVSGVRYVYQGWNLIAELNSSGTLQRSYAWGLDLSGSFGAMGGIGALLQMVDHSGTVASYLPGYDGSGNVAAMMKSDGTISAAYEYGPFGEQLREEGTYAPTNPFRSATKYTDEESGYVYYGMRYYSPSLGRFINRDPIGEKGGVNLYAFCGNNAVNAYDYLGMDMYMTFVQDEYGNTYIEEGGPSADDLHDANLRAANNQNWMSYAEGKADGALKAVIAYENAANLRALMKSLNSSASKAMSIVAQKNQAVALGSATNLTNSFSSQLGASGAAGLANKINAGMDAANAALAGANLGAAQAIADSALHNLGRGAVVTIGTPTVISWDFAPGIPTATTGPHNTADNDGPSVARQAWGAALESGGRYAGAVVEAFKFWNLPQNIANFAGSHAASAIYDSSNYFSLSGSGAFLEQQFGTAEGWGSFLGSILAGSVVPDLSYVELPSVRAPSGTTQALAMNVAALLIDWQPAFRDGYMLPDYATMEAPNEIALFAEPIDFRPPAAGGSGAPPKH